MLKKIIVGVAFVCAVILGALLWQSGRKERTEAARYEKLNEKRRPLLVEKHEIEQRLVDLENEYEASKLPKGTTQIIFTGLEADVYNVCYPMMKEFEYTGTLAVSPSQLPGAEGLMTEEQFRELVAAGWKVCVKWDASRPANQWWQELQKRLTELGVEECSTAYFTSGTYHAGLDAELLGIGFSVVIHHGEESESLIQTAEEEGLWHLGAVGLMGEKPKLRLKEAVAGQGNIAYLIGFELEDEKYEERSFRAMLKCFKEYEESSELYVLDPIAARQHYRERLKDYGEAKEAEYQQKRAAIEEELAAVKKELSKLKIQ